MTSFIQKVLNLGQSWQATYQHYINNPPQDAASAFKMKYDLMVVGAQVFSFAQIVRHNLDLNRKVDEII